mgnify:FL=1
MNQDLDLAVSVVIPYYHGGKYLPDLLEMLRRNAEAMKESCWSALEAVFVNDSPDETLTIEDKGTFFLKVVENPQNSGIHASRVNGLRRASGKYVLFLDQDDRITDDCLVSQLRHIGNADFVIGNGYDGEASGGKHLIYSNPEIQEASADLNAHYYYNNLIRSPGQVLIRRQAIPEYWTEQIMKNNGSDDAFLWILMLCSGAKAALNPDVVYEHVYTGENSSSNDAAMLRSQMEVAEKLKTIASPRGMRAFTRRARYYCTSGPMHKLCFLDVGIRRSSYARRQFRPQEKG